MSVDNPYYFYHDGKSPKTPDSNSKGFSFFRRRNSKGNASTNVSNKNTPTASNQTRSINSATLSNDATYFLGNSRCNIGSPQSFEIQNANSLNSIYRQTGKYGGIQRERLGSFNESVSYHSENDDVFLQTSKIHATRTLPTTSHANRRHSFGNLINHQRSTSFTDEVPNMIAPKPPMISPCKYRGSKRKDDCRESCNMDDILIITAKHSERAFSWASFLRTRFDKITKQRDRKPFNFFHIKIDDDPITLEMAQKCQSTALQIAIICPAILAMPHKKLMSQFSAVLNQEKILAILLDVAEEKVLEIHKTAFPSFRKWKRCVVKDNDQTAIGNILGISTDILGRALCQRPPCQDGTLGSHSKMNRSFSNSTEEFTVVPRKVKIGQNKVLVLLNEPLTKDDSMKILIERSAETIEVKNFKQRNPYTLQFHIPESCMEISTMIEIHIEKNSKNLGCRPIKCESRLRELEQLLRSQESPIEFMCNSLGIGTYDRDALDSHLLQCFQRNMPTNFHLLAGPQEKSNIKESISEEIPTLLHFAAKWGLERLAMQLLECPGGEFACEIKNVNGKTPADIAEQENFYKLANSLKSFSQMHEFATMYHYFKGITDSTNSNVVIETKPSPSSSPIVIKPKISAKDDSSDTHHKNEQINAEYMEMSSGSEGELSSKLNVKCTPTLAVTNLNYINIEAQEDFNASPETDELYKSLDEVDNAEHSEVITNELKINEPPYYQSNGTNKSGADQFSQECTNLLDNCSISSNSDYMLQPSNIPIERNEDYIIQPSNKPVESILNGSTSSYMNDSIISNLDDSIHLKLTYEKKNATINRNGTLKRTSSDASSTKGNADDELAEIMYDFKNNVLSIREVEQLVEKWKNRNDVKQSFKEKQEQIEKLRDEYEKVQEKIKENMKRPTPFERVKKLFSRNKSTTTKNSVTDDNDETKLSIRSFPSTQRPISSLSLQSVSSSASSGRMSTGSVCSGASLGDSGTHSDHEDRRNIFPTNCRIGSPGSLIDGTYLIPPSPRPILLDGKDRLVFTTNHQRVTTPTSPFSNDGEHYVMFPSNVPVYSADNQCGLNTIIETKETTNDFIGTTTAITPIKLNNSHEKNIIYGKLNRNRPKEFYSSFKPQCHKNPILNLDCKKEMLDVYQNINGQENQKQGSKPKKLLLEDDIQSPKKDEHNYINI